MKQSSRFTSLKRLFGIGLILGLNIVVYAQDNGVLFASGNNGYNCFRIPALVSFNSNNLVAFSEGRKDNCADFGDVDIVMCRSSDGGKTWNPIQIVVDNDTLQAGNPTPVIDWFDSAYPGGRLFLFYNTGTASEQDTRSGMGRRRAFYVTSADRGLTWSEATEISSQVHFDRFSDQPQIDARSLALAPGHAEQLKDGIHKGRLFIPANHSLGPPQEEFAEYRSYAMYSDNHGKSWSVSPDLDVPASNEAMAAHLGGDSLLLLVRMQDRKYERKLLARSIDAGNTWESHWIAQDLTTPMCQSALLNVADASFKGLYHCGPAETNARKRLMLWHSKDGGLSWSIIREIWPGSAAYSDITYLGGGTIGVLYEREDYREIAFVKTQL